MTPFLPYGRQQIEDDDIEAVVECLRSDFLTTGPRVAEFEASLLGVTGALHAVACANGTAALHLASLALGLGPEHQVIVPSVTFVATANAPHLAGAEVVFADVDPDTGLLTPTTLREALDRAPRARAVFPVHLNGACVDMPALRGVASERGLAIVEDACHALGSLYDAGEGQGRIGDGRFSDLICFSFHPVKAIAMGEGGAVTTIDPALAERMHRLRSHALIRDSGAFQNPELAFDEAGRPNPWYYELPEPGFNYRVPDILCALGISQLRKLDRFVSRRRHLAKLYDDALRDLDPLVRPVPRPAGCESAFHIYVVLIDFAAAGRSRSQVVAGLRSRGIGTQVHYVPVHRQPYYAAKHGDLVLEGADTYYRRILSLPLYPGMADSDIERVVQGLRDVLDMKENR